MPATTHWEISLFIKHLTNMILNIIKSVATGFNSQVYDNYKQTDVSPTGRHHVPVSDSPRLCKKHQLSDGSVLPDPPNTSGGNSMAPDNVISPDRATKVKRYDRTGTGNESITDTCLVSNELSTKQASDFVTKILLLIWIWNSWWSFC